MRRLHKRIFLYFLGVLAIVGAVTMVVFFTGWRSAFPRSLTERFVQFGAAEVAEHFDDPAARERTVRKMASQLDVEITVRDPDGRVIIARGPTLPPLGAADREEALRGPVVVRHGKVGDWFVAAPIVDSSTGEVRGIIETTPVRRFHSPSPMRPALVAALALLIAGALTAPLARRISRPVERLTDATRRFGDGDLSARVPIESFGPPDCEPRQRHRRRRRFGHHRLPDEIDELSRAWNEMADRVERLVRGQKELMANVSHELRSPLARIRMALELLPREPSDEARVRDIETDLTELDRLIDDVLTASRLEATGLPTRPGPLDLGPLLTALGDRAKLDPLVAGHEVRVDQAGEITLTGDGALVRRAVWNLVENAAKYGQAPITIAARVEGARVLVSVSDEGAGIPPADRARVLDPFERMDKARTPSGGNGARHGFGLGLTIARRVAEAHGGAIRIEAARVEAGVERGCRITLDLPREATV